MTTEHWFPPDIRGDILAAAMRPDAAEPATIHVRPEVHARICPRRSSPDATDGSGPDTSGLPAGIRLVVDDRLPRTPGYEIHRVAPPEPGHPCPAIRPAADAPAPAGPRAGDAGASVPAPCAVTSPSGGHRRGPRSRELRWLLAHVTHPRQDRPASPGRRDPGGVTGRWAPPAA
jgi:hypothetical protein